MNKFEEKIIKAMSVQTHLNNKKYAFYFKLSVLGQIIIIITTHFA